MQRTRRLAARFSAAFGLLALPAGLTGCVTPHLDGLATAECARHDDCSDGLACIEGQCTTAPDPMPDGGAEAGLDMTPDVMVDAAPDARPDVIDLDGPPDAIPDGPPDMTPDVMLDGPPDVLPDVLPDVSPDMEADLAVDMEIDAGCVPQVETCNGIDDDCDENVDEVDDAADPLCPALEGVASQSCVEGQCTLERCEPGRFDLDELLDNGCECIAFAGFDRRELPEPLGIDADCDGAPGDADIVIYASADAEPGGDGTVDAPFSGADEALAAARERPQAAVLFAPGEYRFANPVDLEPGATLLLVAGFVPGEPGEPWTRVAADAPLVELDIGAHSPAMRLREESWLGLDGVRVLAAGTPAPVGVRGVGCQRFDMVDSVLRVTGPVGAQARQEHDGGDGADGVDAIDAASPGEPGTDNGGPGAGGLNPECADADGGEGGTGLPDVPAADQGDAAADGNAPGGAGAGPDAPAEDGVDGTRGADGAPGESGNPAGRWSAAQAAWLRDAGRGPADGRPGGGGGGGGAGFGAEGQPGVGGGGGGAGGCFGTAAQNGSAGFGAFGVVSIGACTVSLEASVIDVAAGGAGGDGAAGGLGAPGAAGGAAGENPEAIQPGGAGGAGANGGCGGDGAGGPGGPSVGILRIGDGPAPVIDADSEVRVAEPSVGGLGGSNPGCPREAAEERAPDGPEGLSIPVACCAPDDVDCGDLLCADQR